MALTLPFSAAAWYQDRARPRSLATPSPRSYSTASRYWAGARPALAARSSQCAASVRFCGVPLTFGVAEARSRIARGHRLAAAAWRKGSGPRSGGGRGRLVGIATWRPAAAACAPRVGSSTENTTPGGSAGVSVWLQRGRLRLWPASRPPPASRYERLGDIGEISALAGIARVVSAGLGSRVALKLGGARARRRRRLDLGLDCGRRALLGARRRRAFARGRRGGSALLGRGRRHLGLGLRPQAAIEEHAR